MRNIIQKGKVAETLMRGRSLTKEEEVVTEVGC